MNPNDSAIRQFIHKKAAIVHRPITNGLVIEDATLDIKKNYQKYTADETSGIFAKDNFQFSAAVAMQARNMRTSQQAWQMDLQYAPSTLVNSKLQKQHLQKMIAADRYKNVQIDGNRVSLTMSETPQNSLKYLRPRLVRSNRKYSEGNRVSYCPLTITFGAL